MTETPCAETPPHYRGQQLVSEGSFLRRVPNVVNPEQRLRLDALCFSADALTHSWLMLRDIAVQVGSDTEQMTARVRAAAFDAAWSIVDQLHAVRQLVSGLVPKDDGPRPLTSKLLSELESARSLRNKMDHLSGNLRNMAARKGARSALFGSLSYFLATEPPFDVGYSVVVQAGLIHGQETWKLVNPAGRLFSPPADLFELSAFDIDLELGPPIARFGEWLDASVPDYEKQISDQARATSAEGEHSFEKLMAHHGSGYTIALAFKFGGEPQPTDSETELRMAESGKVISQGTNGKRDAANS